MPPPPCSGCSACTNICPNNAISLVPNSEGFLSPVVNSAKCTNCSLCKNICPIANDIKTNNKYYPETYAFCADDDIRAKSSSGGVFPILAEYFINKGGYVAGAIWNDDFSVSHIVSCNKNDIEKMKQSKYPQSNLNDCFSKIKSLLDSGIDVLFTGTPCQNAGLNAFLHKNYDNLYCIDLICYGIASPMVFKKYLQELLHEDEKVLNVSLRNKKAGWNAYTASVQIQSNNGVYSKNIDFNKLFSSSNLFINDECSKCKFKTFPRQGDVTIGDFWGIGCFNKKFDDDKGTSLVICNNDQKGKFLINILKNKAKKWGEVPLEFSLKRNSLVPTYQIKPERQMFFELIKEKSVNKAVEICHEDAVDFIIVNFWFSGNFGSGLTAYALQELIQSLGYTTKLLKLLENPKLIGAKRAKKFADKFLFITRKYPYSELPNLAKKVKGVILGSDQVLRFKYILKCKQFYTTSIFLLSWVLNPNARKIALSASFGVNEKEYLQENFLKHHFNYVKNQLRSFDYLSCRELTGTEIFKNLFGLNSDFILDPVFLIDKSKWEHIAAHSKINNSDKIVSYLFTNSESFDVKLLIKYLEEKKHSESFNIPIFDEDFLIEDWVKSFKDAKMILTNSFHGTCFALIFHKPFICIRNKEYGNERLDNLIKLFGLDKNFVDHIEDIYDKELNYDVDYDLFEKKLSEIKEQNIEKIKKVLNSNYSTNTKAPKYRKRNYTKYYKKEIFCNNLTYQIYRLLSNITYGELKEYFEEKRKCSKFLVKKTDF